MFAIHHDQTSYLSWKLMPPPTTTGGAGPGTSPRKPPASQGDPAKKPGTRPVQRA